MGVRFTIRSLLLPLRSFKVRVLLLAYMKTTFGRVEFLAGPTFRAKKTRDLFPLYSILKTAGSISSDQALMNNHTPKQRSSGDFAFTFPTLFESGN